MANDGKILLSHFFLADTSTLRMLKVSIPSYTMRSDIAVLECHYQLRTSGLQKTYKSAYRDDFRVVFNRTKRSDGGFAPAPAPEYNDYIEENHSASHDSEDDDGDEEALYSVKWYRDNEEFYRFIPKDNPPQQSYAVEGIKVDVSVAMHTL